MLDENKTVLLDRLLANWPNNLKFTLADGLIQDLEKHLLGGELAALVAGKPLSLPFFVEKDREVRWFTAAQDADELRITINKLRCWILPSFGWEELVQPVVAPGRASGQLGKLIASIFPSGYFRWRSSIIGFSKVAGKLRDMRQLDDLKPAFVFEKTPSLFELRQRFKIALATGNRDAAMEAVDTIDHHQLDTAVNTAFMRIRLWDQFREYGKIIENQDVPRLVYLRLPRSTILSIVQAYHAVHLARYEEIGDLERAATSYLGEVHPILAGIIRTVRPEDGTVCRRCLAYLARAENDLVLARLARDGTEDPITSLILEKLLAEKKEKGRSEDAEVFYRAMRQGDWAVLQESGIRLLRGTSEKVPPALGQMLPAVLRHSLDCLPNEKLAQLLLALHPEGFGKEIFAPQSWGEFMETVSYRRWDLARRFLNAEKRPQLSELGSTEVGSALDMLEEILTDPNLSQDRDRGEVAGDMVAAFIDDFVKQESFPEDRHVDTYFRLLQIWSSYKAGSAVIPDGQLLLALSHAILSYRGDEKGEIGGAIRFWWQTRKVRALAPFLIEGLELLINYTSDIGLCENLWIELAELVRRDPEGYSPGEKALLRMIGRRLNLDEETVRQFLKLETPSEGEEEDIICRAGLLKVAIVSLHEKAACLAAKMIQERTKAQVVLVTEKDAGPQTNSAKSADVILFVWSASKHAVYRAFDGLRDKIVYVQGVGASSILLALERWAMKNLALR